MILHYHPHLKLIINNVALPFSTPPTPDAIRGEGGTSLHETLFNPNPRPLPLKQKVEGVKELQNSQIQLWGCRKSRLKDN
jgi:hypothetical protein